MHGNTLRRALVMAFGVALAVAAQPISAFAAPASNDNFADAMVVGGVPFADTQDTTEATLEAGEQSPSCGVTVVGTVWYSFTPATSGSVTATADSLSGDTVLDAYTGSSLSGLTSVGCRVFTEPLGLHVDAGTTYYFRAGLVFGQGDPITFRLIVSPPPVAAFSPPFFTPSIFDAFSLSDASFDPGGAGIQTRAWAFGDGATTTGFTVSHQYASDGDYTVTLTVTTVDGRSASTTRVVHVETHDVAVAGFDVPKTAKVGTTQRITVKIRNVRRPDTVQVVLRRSDRDSPISFILVGTLTQSVPVGSATKTTPFDFDYTFTDEDLAVGSVTFAAEATIVGGIRDALPGDNAVIAIATKVRP